MPQSNRNDVPPHWTIPALAVTVEQLAPTEFIWKLIERRSGHPVICVAHGLERFADYEQALDYGFVALKGSESALTSSSRYAHDPSRALAIDAS
ncbi:hypothetical protein WKW79_21905 [Variovorax robiniae]|uniref:Uncharacterized protein n=1 Tax=Variovorax robiniae TaxID=1836199 RepID=A0ABU8XBM9_9BURK